MIKEFIINNVHYYVETLLGHGKSGYSYLVRNKSGQHFVIKHIHHEKVDYYTFGDKFATELSAYNTLHNLNILMPRLLDHDAEQEVIVKEYIEGKTIFDLVNDNVDISIYTEKMKKIANHLAKHNYNIDYFPTNFVVNGDELYYVDYEINMYMEQWNFTNWGSKYWYKSNEFIQYVLKKSA